MGKRFIVITADSVCYGGEVSNAAVLLQLPDYSGFRTRVGDDVFGLIRTSGMLVRGQDGVWAWDVFDYLPRLTGSGQSGDAEVIDRLPEGMYVASTADAARFAQLATPHGHRVFREHAGPFLRTFSSDHNRPHLAA